MERGRGGGRLRQNAVCPVARRRPALAPRDGRPASHSSAHRVGTVHLRCERGHVKVSPLGVLIFVVFGENKTVQHSDINRCLA